MKTIRFAFLLALGTTIVACQSPEERRASFMESMDRYADNCSRDPKGCGWNSVSAYGIIGSMPYSNGHRDENGDIVGVVEKSEIMKYDTLRDKDWIVIWDGTARAYKAVDVGYLREIEIQERIKLFGSENEYYDSSDSTATMPEYTYNSGVLTRNTGSSFSEDDTPTADSWEYVTYDVENNIFTGTSTGYKYEDEVTSYDVSLMTAEEENLDLFQKVGNISSQFQMSVETSMGLVQLSEFAQKAAKNPNGFSKGDKLAIENGLGAIAGVSATEILKAMATEEGEKEVLAKIAKKIGTSSGNLKQRILPELLGIDL